MTIQPGFHDAVIDLRMEGCPNWPLSVRVTSSAIRFEDDELLLPAVTRATQTFVAHQFAHVPDPPTSYAIRWKEGM